MSRLHSLLQSVCFILVILLDFTIAESYPPQNYKLVKDYGAGTAAFFNNFNFYTGADPTDGDVK